MKAELKKEISSVWKIFYLAKQSFQYSEYLHKPDTLEEVTEISNNHFLKFTRHAILRVLIIELSKLFNKDNINQKFSISKLLNKLKKDGYFSKLKFNQEKLAEWESKLKSYEMTIININILRDKLYAHTDRNKPDVVHYGFEFDELRNLLQLTEDIIFQLNSDLFETHSDLRTEFERREMDTVKNLVEFRKGELQNFWEQIKNEKHTNS